MLDNAQFDALLRLMLKAGGDGLSDLLFVPGKPPQIEVYGELQTPPIEWPASTNDAELIRGYANLLINGSPKLLQDLEERGACDCSYSLEGECRLRGNIYRQKQKLAIVLRVLQPLVPSIDKLGLEPVFYDVIKEKNGITFVTGGSGNGKSTTLAALLNEINRTSKVHIITLEDPIEFVHPHLNCTFSQRELGYDFYTFAEGMRSALRQAPKVILVGEIRDRETMEIALTASETGHMIYSTLHTISAAQSINRILGLFNRDEEHQIRERLAGSLRYIIGQRLVPKKDGGRVMVTEVMGHNLRTRETIALGENENRRLSEIIEVGRHAGWHTFEQSLIKVYEQGLITEDTAMLYATNKPAMRQLIDIANTRMSSVVGKGQGSAMFVVPPRATTLPPPSSSASPAETGLELSGTELL